MISLSHVVISNCILPCNPLILCIYRKGGSYDHEKTFTANIGIEPPLLSRFDLIFKLIDGSDPSKDDNVATFLLNRAIQVCLLFLVISLLFARWHCTKYCLWEFLSGHALSRLLVGFWIRMLKEGSQHQEKRRLDD